MRCAPIKGEARRGQAGVAAANGCVPALGPETSSGCGAAHLHHGSPPPRPRRLAGAHLPVVAHCCPASLTHCRVAAFSTSGPGQTSRGVTRPASRALHVDSAMSTPPGIEEGVCDLECRNPVQNLVDASRAVSSPPIAMRPPRDGWAPSPAVVSTLSSVVVRVWSGPLPPLRRNGGLRRRSSSPPCRFPRGRGCRYAAGTLRARDAMRAATA